MTRGKFGALSSSVDPEKLSNTVRAAILGVSSLIVMLADWLGLPLAPGDVETLAVQAGLAVSSLWFFYGLVQKAVAGWARN